MNKSVKTRTNISNLVKAELPELHTKLIKKLKGKHNLINNFTYIPDGDGLGNIHALNPGNTIIYDINECLKTGRIKYDLVGFSFNRLMQLKCTYLIEDEESELCSTAWLLEDAEGWRVTKIEAYWNPYQ
jgi:hypothetical protein